MDSRTTKVKSPPTLPAWRVRVIRDGKSYPWTPPAPTADTTEAATAEVTVITPPVAMTVPTVGAAPRGRPYVTKQKPLRVGKEVIAISPMGVRTWFPSVEAAARATGQCTMTIARKCNGKRVKTRWSFCWAGVSQ